MEKPPHLLACISGHGYGHIAQTAPVLNALHERRPGFRLTVRSPAPLAQLRARIRAPFEYLPEPGDAGMLMASSLDVRVGDSVTAYQHLHRDWGLAVTNEARRLRELAPDFVLSNVGYLPLAGAFRAGIPGAGMGSLNWGDVFNHYCAAISGTRHIVEQIRLSYANARAFLRLTPGMPMPGLHNLVEIGPVAATGRRRRAEIDAALGLTGHERLVLVSLGGFDSHFPLDRWPRIPDVIWLVSASWRNAHPDARVLEALGMEFSDVLASCDTLICKPGYGSFVEAACAGVPVLYASRPDWPETPCLAAWLEAHGTGREVTRSQLESGDFAAALQGLLEAPRRAPATAEGAAQAADWLARQLFG